MTPEEIKEQREWLDSLTGHTPGPWELASPGSDYPKRHIGSGGVDADSGEDGVFYGYHICETTGFYSESDIDARLIAAAPDLHAHLTDALDEIERLRAAEAEDMRLATDAYRMGQADAEAGFRKCDPRVILSHARAAMKGSELDLELWQKNESPIVFNPVGLDPVSVW